MCSRVSCEKLCTTRHFVQVSFAVPVSGTGDGMLMAIYTLERFMPPFE